MVFMTEFEPMLGIAPMVIGAIIGAASGLLKSKEEAKQKAAKAKLDAEMARWSPWTQMRPDTSGGYQTDKMGNVLEGAASGLAQGQKFGEAKDSNASSNSLSLQGDTQGDKVLYDEKGNPYKMSSQGYKQSPEMSAWDLEKSKMDEYKKWVDAEKIKGGF